ncbi:MAG: FG-GAP repeat protein [Phycisphaerales bacterium]|jgi:hypothetical protein|nr:FG-GAP repeat protein [Phycisphaerales bacterium]MDP7190160.1 FG-GAP repeat protein [Phycisphaerales bacterium]
MTIQISTVIATTALAVLPATANVVYEVQEINPNDVAEYGSFGIDLALDGDTVVIGSPGNDFLGLDSGVSWVFVRGCDGEFTELQTVIGSDTAWFDEFGYSTALHGEVMVVGSRHHDAGSEVDSGAAYVFAPDDDGTWIETAKLTAPSPEMGASFGWSVATDGDTIVIGANKADGDEGRVYVFDRDGDNWIFTAELVGSGIDAGDHFGRAVDVDGDTIAVGCPYYAAGCGGSNRCGSLFIFDLDEGVWGEVDRLTPSDQANEDYFGWKVSIDGDRLLTTSIYDDDMGWQSGSGYVFDRIDGVWTEQFKLVPSNGDVQDMAGQCCRLQGDVAVLGGWYGNDDKGAAWVWRQNGSVWSEVAELNASDGQTSDIFGRSIGLDGDSVLVGANWHDADGVADAGAVYAFDISAENLPEGACCTNGTCAIGTRVECEYFGGVWVGDWTVCADVNCDEDCAADVNGDDDVGVDDLLEVIGAWGPCH